ncbi:colipase-like isoform X2 [Erythrolamprus reginae]|uniref:colipase-like isoform X2 n=1 Tax=Erythrolamprus reginae TaxID=121349 RepID=UPI00396CE480
MDRFWILLLLTLDLAESLRYPRGIITDIENGQLCLNSFQCKNGCCHRRTGLSLARCAFKAAENEECSQESLYGVYYKCPCVNDLICDGDRTIVGSILNTEFGICRNQSNQQ